MLTLEVALRIPAHVLHTTVEQEAILLNTLTNQYYALDEVGARFWNLLTEGKTLREVHQKLLEEFEVGSSELEQDLLELVRQLRARRLVETIES